MEQGENKIGDSTVSVFERIEECRLCQGREIVEILDFGDTPIADILCDFAEEDVLKVPLTLGICVACSLVQILETIQPEIVFNEHYPYYSSVSPKLMEYFKSSALHIIEKYKLNNHHSVIEIGSNDGYMLRYFKEKGITTLGIDLSGPALSAQKQGIQTLMEFFSKELATVISEKYNEGFDILLANNVIAHDANINGIIEGISLVLNDQGAAVIEVPYVIDLISKNEFDTIYHQHIFYYSLTSLDYAFRKYSLYINHVEHTSFHGGTLRLYIEKKKSPSESVYELLANERSLGVDNLSYYQSFHDKVTKVKTDINQLLHVLKKNGKRVAGYGAAQRR